ncbi:MAG: hypothetical protein R2939_16215 [Kofleriaceae bacterium]
MLITLIDRDSLWSAEALCALGRYDWRVECLDSAADLLARPHGLPDVIVLCVDPKPAGWAVCNQIKKSATLGGVPLIVTSAEASQDELDKHAKLKARATAYVRKPFPIDAVFELIVALVGRPTLRVMHGGTSPYR